MGGGRCTAAMHGSRSLRPDPRLEIARVVPLMLHWSRPVWMYAKSVPKPLAISLPERVVIAVAEAPDGGDVAVLA